MNDPRFEQALLLAAQRADPSSRARAIELLEALVAQGAASPRARFLLASLHDDHPDGYARAITHYRDGLEGDPNDSAARNNLAVALMATGRQEEAVSELAAVLVDDPGYGLAAQNLARLCLEHLDEHALASLLQRVAEDRRGDALVRLLHAVADAGRQEAFASTYGAGHALKNLIGLAGSRARDLSRRSPEEAELRELTLSLEKVYSDWAAFLKSARSVTQRREACDLNALAAEVEQAFPEPERPRLALTEGPVLALGDPAALREAILNLARNAREASPQGVVEIGTATDAKGAWVRLSVTDDGPGIAPENQRRIFAPGYTTKSQGSGFGLAIAERIARTDGGRIEVQSAVGSGAKFSLILPAATAPVPRLAPRLGAEEYTR
ncbi:MAG: sensor histidine kinase [Deltaproteobacteria bacterium]|nr:sensor histidine kinase [Deltaproteobacteria bacterium]